MAEAGEICTHLNEGLELPILLSPNHHPQIFFQFRIRLTPNELFADEFLAELR